MAAISQICDRRGWVSREPQEQTILSTVVTTPGNNRTSLDPLYGDPATRLTLGFNIARYNIAGGDDPTHKHMRADAQMEGFQSGPGAAFDWTRDAPQRRMLQEAKKRGASILEAASYSPPYLRLSRAWT